MSANPEKVETENVNTNASVDSAMDVFHNRAHFWGRTTLWVLIVMCLVPPLYVSFVLDAHPGWDLIGVGLIGYASFIGIMWVLEPVTYYPTLGIAGTYLAFLTGNIANLCLPSSASAQKAVGAEVGTRKAEVAGTFGIAMASLVNTVIILLTILGGTYILSMLPAAVEGVFDFILPAIFGAVLGQFAYKTPQYGVLAIVIAMVVLFSPVFEAIQIAACVALTITAVLFMEKQKNKSAETKN
ncbi:small-conductance mechanosensitive channel [Salicibibacter cibi]|uniref:Small-conductance mechanosensitive channel n=1 Tax=Salicibibacter cibi TaxID=2743001 RepID=A0A7T6Z9H1_9BACI|nr:small-conductance mechanosensitive channel [Salicibibacter cibi]QQK79358.1 small-conductance mechanosensitive channel [Salicibibacter cibi]